MSGEPTEITLAADPRGTMANLLGHLGEVDRAGLRDWALIGGLAVMVRLEDAHRPTRDIDTLSRQVDPEPKVTLLGIAESETSTGVLLPDGTKVDIIGVEPVPDFDALPDDDGQRMFVLSHWWMAETAELVTLTLVDPTKRDGNVLARRRPSARATPTTSIAFSGPAASRRSPRSWAALRPTLVPGACCTWRSCSSNAATRRHDGCATSPRPSVSKLATCRCSVP